MGDFSPREARNRLMLRARDAMDRRFEHEIDVRALAKSVGMSEAHFSRTFKDVFAETPHRYLQRRRVERAMFLLRDDQRSITDICFDVGFNSLGTFSRTFKEIVGLSPSTFRGRYHPEAVPSCFAMAWSRPSSFGEAPAERAKYSDSAVDGETDQESVEATK
ncbi:MAG TPA: helix-turn-helix transcriptional regulator [Trueperaceae bacterium]|nr:helix-turn-helix transcriptional regulator [Trueperaceae bacterium]